MVPYAGDTPRASVRLEQIRSEWEQNVAWSQRRARPNREWKKYEITILTPPGQQDRSMQWSLVDALLNFRRSSLRVDFTHECRAGTHLSYPIIDARGNRHRRADRYCFTAYIRERDARETTTELSRWLGQQDYVLRHLIVKVDERRVNRH